MKTKYMRIRLTEAEDAIIRDKAKQAGGTLTEYIVGVITSPAKSVITKPVVITNVPTGQQGAKGLSCDFKGKPTPDYVMAKNVRTKPPIDIKSTEKVLVLSGGGKATPAKIATLLKAANQQTCASCSAKIKKGFLCDDCLK